MIPIIWPDDAGEAERAEVLAEIARRKRIGIPDVSPTHQNQPIFTRAANRWYEQSRDADLRCSATRVVWRPRGGETGPCPQCDPLGWARLCLDSGFATDDLARDVARSIASFTPEQRMQIALAVMSAGDEFLAVEVAVRCDAALAKGSLDVGPTHPRSTSAWESWRKRELADLLAGKVARGLRLASNMMVRAGDDVP